jgi:hypothetical protein
MEENQTETYFLRSRLFTYDIMKNFNCNISLWFFKSKFRSYIGKIKLFIKITICVPLNTPSKFKSHLKNPLILNGFWKKAFVEAEFKTTLSRFVCLLFVCYMVINVTFNNISVISWRSVLLVEQPEYPGKTTDLS